MDEVEKAHSDTPETAPDFPQSETQNTNKEKTSQIPATQKQMGGLRRKLLIILAIVFLTTLLITTVLIII